jgi:hypothetical protein
LTNVIFQSTKSKGVGGSSENGSFFSSAFLASYFAGAFFYGAFFYGAFFYCLFISVTGTYSLQSLVAPHTFANSGSTETLENQSFSLAKGFRKFSFITALIGYTREHAREISARVNSVPHKKGFYFSALSASVNTFLASVIACFSTF